MGGEKQSKNRAEPPIPPEAPPEPAKTCDLCPRLAAFRAENRAEHPGTPEDPWWNAPVPSFGKADVRLLIVGLAPGLRGANRTGRPFTGDYAGDLLYPTLIKYGFARGTYDARPGDGLELVDARITNAVRCVPPRNKPETGEIKACNPFLSNEIKALSNLTHILALGRVAHEATLLALHMKKSAYKFVHAGFYELECGLTLTDSYHCSRYNTNTGRLTEAMFHDVFEGLRAHMSES